MRKITRNLLSFLVITAFLLTNLPFVFAIRDEGMFPPDRIERLDLKKKGLKINPSEIYGPNGGLATAVVRLSIGCSGEFVSPNGLILTNHHCAFDALVSASSADKDYGRDGFRAGSMAEEIPAKNYSVFITNRVEDVTNKVLEGTENLTGAEREKAIENNIKKISDLEKQKLANNDGISIRIQSTNNGLFYYLYETYQIKDVRLVYAPPKNIGFFGGDPDNFEWTRHAGDFAFLRAYVAPDGKPAEYSQNNVPYKPKRYLVISLDGVKENDFVFVLGYPGSTTRYRESWAIKYAQEVNLPFLVKYLRAWSDGLVKAGEEAEEKRVKLQSEIFSLNNSLKAFEGGIIALRRGEVVAKRKAEEERLSEWINASQDRKAKYGNVLPELQKLSEDFYKTGTRDRILRTIPNPASTPTFWLILDAVSSVSDGKKLDNRKRNEIMAVFSSREPVAEEEIMKFYFKALDELPSDQKFELAEKIFAGKTGRDRRAEEASFINSILRGKDFDSAEKIMNLYEMSLSDLSSKYPKLIEFCLGLLKERKAIAQKTESFSTAINELRYAYQKAMAEMKKIEPYPDANSTLRFTYGYVKGYQPREAVIYTPFTTLKGMVEKDTGVEPFDMPIGLKQLQQKRDFGRYGVGDSVPLNFLSTVDIIGGNSGSPILNAQGEQVGIIFDGNYEGLGNDFYYDPMYNRAIAVDIRFVLFVTEKFANAGWIVNELTTKQRRVASSAK